MVMNVLEEHFGSVYTGHQLMEVVGSGQIVCADQIRLHSPINEKTSVSNLNIIHFSCIVSLCYMYTCEAIHSPVILHYTVV